MITRVEIKNYRCLRDVVLDLDPLTVLVGPNASGKSAILRALELDSWGQDDVWRHGPGTTVSIRAERDDGSVLVAPEGWRTGGVQKLQLDPGQLRQSNMLARETQLQQDGRNLTNLFGTLTRKQQESFAQHFCALVPMFADVDTEAVVNGHHRLRFQDRWSPEVWYHPYEVSDGTMLVAAFLMLHFQSATPEIITIEEPERGLHPYLIGELVNLLRDMSTGKVGARPIQVVLATHSAELLEFARPDEVRFLDRVPADGSVKVTQIDPASPDWQRSFKEYAESLGGAWLAGGLGGVPGGAAAAE